MSSSTGSGDVVDEGAWWSAEAVVEADRCCECEEAHSDPGAEAVERAGAVAFEGEQVFAGLEDRLDSLPDWGEVGAAAGFVLAARAHNRCVEFRRELLELAAGVALVAEHVEVPGAAAAFKQREADLAFGRFGRGEHQRARCAVEREQAVQAEAPEVAAVACAVAVVGGVSELAAAGRLDAAGALHGRGVDQHQIVVEAGAVAREDLGQPLDRVAEGLAPLQIAAPVWQRREQVRELVAGHPDEAGEHRVLHWSTVRLGT